MIKNTLYGEVQIFDTPSESTTELSTVLGRRNEDGSIIDLSATEISLRAKDVPDTVLFSCAGSTTNPDTGLLASRLLYITDQKRNIFLEPDIVPDMFGNASSVFVDGNFVYICYYSQPVSPSNTRQWGFIRLELRMIGNELVVIDSDYLQIPVGEFSTTVSPSKTLHGEAFDGEYLYYTTREPSALEPTTFIKVNAKNFEDYKIATPFNGGTLHNVELYKNYLYYIWVADDESSAHIGRIDTNLRYAEEVYAINTDITRFVNQALPILIYEDEIFLFTINNTSASTRYGKFVLQVYSMTGELKRETPVIDLDPSVVTGELAAHWMQAYNGKIIIHTATATSVIKSVIRIDAGFGVVGGDGYIQPAYEEHIISPARSLSDDNTIINGKLWLSSETSSSFPLERRLYVIDDYRDLAAIYEYDSTDYFSGGTQVIPAKKETLKTKLSEFEDDIAAGTATLQSVTDNGNSTTGDIKAFNFYAKNGGTEFLNIGEDGKVNSNQSLQIDGALGNIDFLTNLITADRAIEVPNASGTIALEENQTLQSVTDNGAVTMNAITVPAVNFPNSAFIDSQPNDLTIAHPEAVFLQNDFSAAVSVENGHVGVTSTGFKARLKTTNLTANRNVEFQDSAGTLAYLTDIPAGGTIDAVPTDGSANAVSSNGVFDALALKFTNGGDAASANMVLGTTTAFNTEVIANNNVMLTVASSGLGVRNGSMLFNVASSSIFSLNVGGTGASPTIVRDRTTAESALIIRNANSTSTGKILSLESNISGTTAERAFISKQGDIEITSATAGIILKDAGDGSRRRITVVNGVLTVSAAL